MNDSTKTVFILIPTVPPAQNKLIRMHWAERKRTAERWKHDLWACIPHHDRLWLQSMAALEKRMDVSICVYHQRLFDPDNLPSTAKFILDGLVNLEYLADDDAAHVVFHIEQEKRSVPATSILIQKALQNAS